MNTTVERINIWLDTIFQVLVLLLVFLTSFLFLNQTTEFYEIPKLIALIGITGLLLIIWGLKTLVTGKLIITRTPLDLPLLLLLGVLIVSSFFAAAPYPAIFGNLPRVSGGLIAMATYIIAYFILVSNQKQTATKQTIYLLLISAFILAALSILSYAGIHFLPFAWAKALNFTPTGSSFSTSAIIVLSLSFPLSMMLHQSATTRKDIILKVVTSVVITTMTASVVLIGSWQVIAAGVVVLLLNLFAAPPAAIKKNLPYVAAPIIVAVLLTIVSVVPITGLSIFRTQAQNFPREVQLPFKEAWKVSISTFRDYPLIGSGPGSYLTDFTIYKPTSINSTKYWNLRFDQSFNQYLELLATTGALGLLAFLLLTLAFLPQAFKTSSDHISISAIAFFIMLLLHVATIPVWTIGIILLALFMVNHKNVTHELNLLTPSTGKHQINIAPMFIALVAMGAVAAIFYWTTKFTMADYYHRLALNSAAQNKGLNAYNQLIKAEKFNPYIDLYRTDLAQTNFALANALATAKGPSQASPSGSLTDDDKKNIQTLLSQAIAEGRAAVTLNPNNPVNWEILGSIYRQISGVAQNAINFSLDSYNQALAKDPVNPALRLTVGGVYYSIKSYDMAIRLFTDAITIKPDFPNGYYNLAVVLKDKGDMASAAIFAEKLVSLVDPKSADYKIASELLASLKEKLATTSAQEQSSTLTPPAKANSALQNKNLPKVLDLPKSEGVATPPAVKK